MGVGTQKLSQFSEERVLAEIDYISKRCTKAATLYVCDANFGIFERDAKIARKMYQCHLQYGFPHFVVNQWNKNRPDRIYRVAKELKGIVGVSSSFQSFNPQTLKTIGRTNLPVEDVVILKDKLKKCRITVCSELILGLPFETRETHIKANKTLIDIGMEVVNYNLHLLPGTALDSKEYRSKYIQKTGWRLHDNAYGIYGGEGIFEGQEVVLETSTITKKELMSFRFVHFLIQFMWGRKWYYDFLLFQKKNGIHPLDFILNVAEKCSKDNGQIGMIYKRFSSDHGLETFKSEKALYDFWNQDDSFERLRSGNYEKLNSFFSTLILLEYHDAFNRFLYELSEEMNNHLNSRALYLHQCREILRFCEALKINLTEEMPEVEKKSLSFEFDILSWRNNNYVDKLKIANNGLVEYEFFLTEPQKKFLKAISAQFRSQNINMSLRKMTEDIFSDDFLYYVKMK